jgi:hypothetical protein
MPRYGIEFCKEQLGSAQVSVYGIIPNARPIHSALGYLSHKQFEDRLAASRLVFG